MKKIKTNTKHFIKKHSKKKVSLKQIKKWWKAKKNKPITWGNYATYCKWSFGILGIIYLAMFIWLKVSSWRATKKAEEKATSGRYAWGEGED